MSLTDPAPDAPAYDGLGDAGQAFSFNAVAAAGAAGLDLVKKHQVIPGFLY